MGSLVFGFILCYPMLGHFGQITPVLDWSRALDWSWTDWRTIAHYHQFPFWNPYKCGGMPSLANPLSHFLSPFLLLRVIFGPVAGLELEVPLHVSVAFSGGYLLARQLNCRPIASLICAIVFGGSSWLPLHAAAGHDVLLPGAYLPWVCAFTWMAIKRRQVSWAAAAGLFLALCFFEGGAYEVLELAVFLTVIGAVESVLERSPQPILLAALAGLFSAAFSAFKLLPSIVMMRVHPRPGYLSEESLYKTFLSIFSRKQDFTGPWGEGGFWEHGAYVSVVFAALALVGIIKAPRRGLPWAVAAAAFFVLGMGGTSPHSMYVLLHRFPGFESTYAPFRFLIAFVLAASVLAALGGDVLLDYTRWGVVALLIFGTLDVLIVSPVSLYEVFTGQAISVPPRSPEFRQYYDPSPTDMLAPNLANLGAVNCYEANFLDVNVTHVLGYNQPGYRGEEYLQSPGTLRLLRWTPEELEYQVATPGPNTLVINQNYYDGWRLRDGTGTVVAYQGMVAVELPAGSQKLTVAYRAPWAVLGAWMFLFASALTVFLFWHDRRRERTG
ncbi:MAG TPA: hypothetical protein VMV27_06190 [Candidatus Binataceae bacterium]|nr:hypothetical protein [Candidatus Binataceae bacterium]